MDSWWNMEESPTYESTKLFIKYIINDFFWISYLHISKADELTHLKFRGIELYIHNTSPQSYLSWIV